MARGDNRRSAKMRRIKSRNQLKAREKRQADIKRVTRKA
jgi:hypothetical protein